MFNKLYKKIKKNHIKNNKGQGATEYILLVAVVVGVVMMFGPKIKEKLKSTTDQLGQGIESTTSESMKN